MARKKSTHSPYYFELLARAHAPAVAQLITQGAAVIGTNEDLKKATAAVAYGTGTVVVVRRGKRVIAALGVWISRVLTSHGCVSIIASPDVTDFDDLVRQTTETLCSSANPQTLSWLTADVAEQEYCTKPIERMIAAGWEATQTVRDSRRRYVIAIAR